MSSSGRARTATTAIQYFLLRSSTYQPSKSVLNAEERRVLDWVVATYDHLLTTGLIDITHKEMAYWDTAWKQPIDYNIAEDMGTSRRKIFLTKRNSYGVFHAKTTRSRGLI